MTQEARVSPSDPEEENRLREEIDSLIPQIFPNQDIEYIKIDDVGEDWQNYMPTVSQFAPGIRKTSTLVLYQDYFQQGDKFRAFFMFDAVSLNYLKNGKTTSQRPITKGDRVKIITTERTGDERGEEMRLRMIKEVLDFVIAQNRLDELGE